MVALGLIVLVPPLDRVTFGFLLRRPNTKHIDRTIAFRSELLIIALAAQIISGPLTAHNFDRLSLVSRLSNLLVHSSGRASDGPGRSD